MITDGQVKKLFKLLSRGETLADAARKTGMDEKTARKYRNHGKLPSQMKKPRTYRTREDPFADVWDEVVPFLDREPTLRAITLFRWVQEQYPGRFKEGQRRTFERRVHEWRAAHGPNQEVYFPQEHKPGDLAASDFTHMDNLGVTIGKRPFSHMLYHFVLTYSNWESVTLCYSESFESLSRGFQEAVWEAGGVPARHRSDSLTAAVNNLSNEKLFQRRYRDLMDYYGIAPERINVRKANENGDVESLHGHFKRAVEDALLLRGSRDFDSVEQYVEFIKEIQHRRNAPREKKFREEKAAMRDLPPAKLDCRRRIRGVRVSSSSTIRVLKNVYSVPSRLIGEKVEVVIDADTIDVYYGNKHIQSMPRLPGQGKHAINYRHVIDSLVRKPGAFANYRYQQDLFPSSYFRMAYDRLCEEHRDSVAVRQYLEILRMAAYESEEAVELAIQTALKTGESISAERIAKMIADSQELASPEDVSVDAPDLTEFDSLLPNHDKEVTRDEHDKDSYQSRSEEGRPTGPADDLGSSIDGSVSGTASSHVSGTLPDTGRTSDSGELDTDGVSERTGGAGMPGETREPYCETTATVAATFLQDVGTIRLEATAAADHSAIRESSGWIVSGPSGESACVRETGLGQDALSVCSWGAVDPEGAFDSVHDVQPLGAAAADRQTGLATLELPEASEPLRGADHRRPGLCATESRGDGGPVHAASRTLRAGECALDEQSSVFEMGADLQGCDDDGGRHRPAGAPQRGHRTQRSELSTRDGQACSPEGQPVRLTVLDLSPNPGSLIVAKAEI